jgi:CHASE2 domain-containing sensor protein
MPIFAWLLASAACMFALQALPPTGIFLMFFGGAALTGLLLMLSLFAMLVECLMKRVPPWLIAVPILAVGGYYGYFAYERMKFSELVTGLEQANGGLVFDPERHDIHYGGIDGN